VSVDREKAKRLKEAEERERLRAWAKATVDAWPPLTTQQRHEVAIIMRGGKR
jgi:hypothetical protein